MKTKMMMVGGAFITFFIAASLNAQAPQFLNYQGKLTNNDGTAAAGSFAMTFSIYSTKSGGTALWTETQNVTVTNGVFNVLLGSATTGGIPTMFRLALQKEHRPHPECHR